MKRKIFSLIVVLVVTISFINVWISVGSTNAKVKLRLAAIDAMAMLKQKHLEILNFRFQDHVRLLLLVMIAGRERRMVVLLAGELNIANEELKRKV